MRKGESLGEVYRRIYRIVSKIPEGTVATYGQVGELAGAGPRLVGRALSELPKGYRCPWHRVINARGETSRRLSDPDAHLHQMRLLESEGVAFTGGKTDLGVYRWHPGG